MLPEPNFPVRPGEFVGRRPEIELQVYADSPIIVIVTWEGFCWALITAEQKSNRNFHTGSTVHPIRWTPQA